jgi:hypothetical protein
MKRHWTFCVFYGFAVVGACYLIAEHRDQVLHYLPDLLLVACLFMLLFHGPGGHGHSVEKRTP